MAAAPEVAIPAQLISHPGIFMLPLIVFSILLIIVGIIVLSTAKDSTPGYLIAFLGLLLGGGAFYSFNKSSSSATKSA
jgi:hypothetical protein